MTTGTESMRPHRPTVGTVVLDWVSLSTMAVGGAQGDVLVATCVRVVLGLALCWLLVACVSSCGIVVSFDEFNTKKRAVTADGGDAPPISPTLYAVRGVVTGLDASAKATLVMNGTSLEVGDGPFTFPPSLADGLAYVVTVRSNPSGRACSVANGAGTIAGHDAVGVLVSCLSTDATLQDLAISGAALSPAFGATRLSYVAKVRALGLFAIGLPTTTITATTTHPGARIRIGAASVGSGTPTAPIALKKSGVLPVDIVVTAADGKTTVRYTVVLSATVNDYIKPSNTHADAQFGSAIALSGDTLAVGAYATGGVYVFTRVGTTWSQQAFINPASTQGQWFGRSVALFGDTLAVGAVLASSSEGAVYLFTRTGTTWSEEAYLTASNPRAGAAFGGSVALSGDTLAVGSSAESSGATGINGDQSDTSAPNAGAVYVFLRSGTTWSQQAYVKASNTRTGAEFGVAVTLDSDTLAVGSVGESSNATGINGDQTSTITPSAGAVYVFVRSGSTWSQQAYVKASNTRATHDSRGSEAFFGSAVALSMDTLAVAADRESSSGTGVGGNQSDDSAVFAGAVYVFKRAGTSWSQEAYIKASNTHVAASFGRSVALTGDRLAVGAPDERGGSTGIDGDQLLGNASTGAVFVFTRTGSTWSQYAYVKASNRDTAANQSFGWSSALSGDSLAVGAYGERSRATGINGDQSDVSLSLAGAAYVF